MVYRNRAVLTTSTPWARGGVVTLGATTIVRHLSKEWTHPIERHMPGRGLVDFNVVLQKKNFNAVCGAAFLSFIPATTIPKTEGYKQARGNADQCRAVRPMRGGKTFLLTYSKNAMISSWCFVSTAGPNPHIHTNILPGYPRVVQGVNYRNALDHIIPTTRKNVQGKTDPGDEDPKKNTKCRATL